MPNILTAEKISKSYIEKVLFDDVTFGIDSSDKIGLIGINGTGKSTFLKVIAGIVNPDQGKVILNSGLAVEYLPQNPDFSTNMTILEYVFNKDTPVMGLIRRYEKLLKKSKEDPYDIHVSNDLIRVTQEMDLNDAWKIEAQAKIILNKLGFTDYSLSTEHLSGGEKKRAAMARVLISPADLLILDEPTNHVDSNMVSWLENFLRDFGKALIMVTHDRYFLDRVCNRIIELENGKLFSYKANYTKYLEEKAKRDELKLSLEENRKNLFQRELEWIKRGARARSTKQKARISRFEAMPMVEAFIENR
jgi:ATP-binding cassette subfamily F protein uup